jgi:glycosyltransferase involved in cell wall biosynthesis
MQEREHRHQPELGSAAQVRSADRLKILEIGNYPPPMCGWSIQTKLVMEELRRRGHCCKVLNTSENRRHKSPEYIDVQNGLDYLLKVLCYGLAGYRLHPHVNGESPKGYLLAFLPLIVARLLRRPGFLTFHGGLPQKYFPLRSPTPWYFAYKALFRLAGTMMCDSQEIKSTIRSYGIADKKIVPVATFSPEYLKHSITELPTELENFLSDHRPVFVAYVSFRPEYRLEVLRQAMAIFSAEHPEAGFIWLGFPDKELPAAREDVSRWPARETAHLLLLGNVEHSQFLTLLRRTTAFIRTPACDGVSASVLEALALGVPVVASENGRRPYGVITYVEGDPKALAQQLGYLLKHRSEVLSRIRDLAPFTDASNVELAADLLTGNMDPIVRTPDNACA